jgi:hypothetical protein
MTSAAETRARLDEIRERLAAVRADRWSHEFEHDGERMIVTRAVFDRDGRKAGDEAPVALLTFGEDATYQEKEFIREARDDLSFVLDLLTDAGRTIREMRGRMDRVMPADDGARVKDLAAEAAMKCTEAAFQRFLADRCPDAAVDPELYADQSDSDLAAIRLRRVLEMESRRQLNTDPDAAQRWRDLRADYQAWGRGDGA